MSLWLAGAIFGYPEKRSGGDLVDKTWWCCCFGWTVLNWIGLHDKAYAHSWQIGKWLLLYLNLLGRLNIQERSDMLWRNKVLFEQGQAMRETHNKYQHHLPLLKCHRFSRSVVVVDWPFDHIWRSLSGDIERTNNKYVWYTVDRQLFMVIGEDRWSWPVFDHYTLVRDHGGSNWYPLICLYANFNRFLSKYRHFRWSF